MDIIERLKAKGCLPNESVETLSFSERLEKLLDDPVDEALRHNLEVLQRDIDNACCLEHRSPTMIEDEVRMKITLYLQKVNDILPRPISPREALFINGTPKYRLI